MSTNETPTAPLKLFKAETTVTIYFRAKDDKEAHKEADSLLAEAVRDMSLEAEEVREIRHSDYPIAEDWELDSLIYKANDNYEDETLGEALEKLPTREELKAAKAFADRQVPLPLTTNVVDTDAKKE